MAKEEDWRLCAEWLIRCQILPKDHRFSSGGWGSNGHEEGGDAHGLGPGLGLGLGAGPAIAAIGTGTGSGPGPGPGPGSGPMVTGTDVFQLAQVLRDGVLLCHLVNRLHPGAVDVKDFCQRPQMSQFLCIKNIRTFLQSCKIYFDLRDSDLFDPYDLFDMRNFGKVISTLSTLSRTLEAQKSNIVPFSVNKHSLYYNNLPTLASIQGVSEEPLYGVVDNDHEDDEGDVYGRLVDLLPPFKEVPRTKREYYIKELIVTEKNYIDALQMIKDFFMKPLREILSSSDHHTIFLCIENFHSIHSGFHVDLSKALGVNRDGIGSTTIADCFVTWKEKFLLYGEFCSNLPKAQELLDKLCNSDQLIQQRVLDCQMAANEGRFKLRDLLSVPMQRVLKYHLLLKELIKNTDRTHMERKSLERALEEMLDLSTYVNEVKRDNESLHLIQDIENSIVDLLMPENTTLKDYGRLLKDGELKVKAHSDNKSKTRYVFLFDKVMLLCKSRGDVYSYKHALVMSQYEVEDLPGRDKERNFGFAFILGEKNKQDAYTIGVKTQELRTKWIEAVHMAQDNTSPPFAHAGNHEFIMHSFDQPTICDVCRKLLRGVFYQGYKCQKTNVVVHKECIEKAKGLTGPPKPPPKPAPCRTPSTMTRSERPAKGKVKVICAYQGIPVPTNGRPALPIEVDEVLELLSDDDSYWWEGRFAGREGFFPKECVRLVREIGRAESVVGGHQSATVFRPALVQRTRSFDSHSALNQTFPAVHVRMQQPRLLHSLPSAAASSSTGTSDDGLTGHPWFVGGMTRDEASRKLERLPNGTYLIRVSQSDIRKGEYALSIKYGRGHPVKHIKLQKGPDGTFFLADCKMFHSIVELVQYYQQNSLESSFPEVPTVLLLPYKEAVLQLKAGSEEPGILGYCFAMYDYSAMEPNQLSLKHGDRVAIVSKAGANRGWWKGKLNGKIGYFPSAFVTESEDDGELFSGFSR